MAGALAAPRSLIFVVMQWWTLKQLKSKNARKRVSAIQRLSQEECAAALESLTELLADGNPPVRAAAAAALARTENATVIPRLGTALRKESDPQTRLAITKALIAFPNPATFPFLVAVLTDPAGEVGWNAARALQNLQWQPENDTERAAWHLAVSQFEDALSCGDAAVEPLAKLTRSVAFQRCIRAIECLSRIGGAQAVKPLLDCICSQDFTIRAAAAGALGELGDGRAFEPLVHALRDAHHQVVLAACISLGKMGDQRAVEPLIKVLSHSSPDVRTSAVNSLGKLRDAKAVPSVLELLHDRDPDAREAAVTALGSIGSDQAIEHLVLTLIDSQSSIRQAATYALRKIEPYWERSESAARAIPKLQTALQSNEYWVRHSAADTLKKLGVSRESETTFITASDGALRNRHAAQAILVSMLAESDRDFRQAAAEALGRIGLAEAVPPLAQRLSDTDRGVQSAAARALESLRWQPANPPEKARQLVALERWSETVNIGPEAVDALSDALTAQNPNSRRALEALVQIGGPRAISALRALSTHPEAAIRDQAREALSILETHNAPRPSPTRDVWAELSLTS
jgi:HEAT repeat protein